MTKIPDDLNEDLKGPWLDKPISEQRKEFAKWLEAGNRPDDHPVVRPVEFKPPEGVTPETVAEAMLKASYDRQDKFHCNDCCTKLKYKGTRKAPGQIMSFGDGHLYSIGPDCGSDHQLEMKRQGLKDFRRSVEIEQATDRLINFHLEASKWQLALRALNAIASEALAFQKQAALAARVFEILTQCRKDQGRLWYKSREKRPDFDPLDHRDEYTVVTKQFPKNIRGLTLFETPLPIVGTIKEFGSVLGGMDIHNADKSHWVSEIQKDVGGGIALRRAAQLSQLPGALEQCFAQIRLAQEFFDPKNLAAFNEWAKLDGSLRASLLTKDTSFKITTSELAEGYVEIKIENFLSWTEKHF